MTDRRWQHFSEGELFLIRTSLGRTEISLHRQTSQNGVCRYLIAEIDYERKARTQEDLDQIHDMD